MNGGSAGKPHTQLTLILCKMRIKKTAAHLKSCGRFLGIRLMPKTMQTSIWTSSLCPLLGMLQVMVGLDRFFQT
jgi:hypothetical protein